MNPMPMRVLIIEDEPKLAALLTDYLQRDGYVCTSVHDGGAAIDQIRAIDPAIVLREE